MSSPRTARAFGPAFALALLSWTTPSLAAVSRRPVSPADTLADLRNLLDTAVVLEDRDDDGIVDRLDVRLVLGATPTEADVTAAMNMAARLGFETASSDLGLLAADVPDPWDRPVLAVGRGALERMGLGALADDAIRDLDPGEGALVHLPSSASLPWGGAGVVAYDATGLMAVSAYTAGRYPAVWNVDGDTWSKAAARVSEFLTARDVAGTTSLDRIVVAMDAPGVVEARLTVRLSDTASYQRALQAFEGGDSTTAADTTSADHAPPKLASLEIRDLRRLDLRLVAPGGEHTVVLRPRKPWTTPADGELRPGPDRTFGLADLYSIEGLFRDTNRDLVPDQTAADLSVRGADASSALVDLATRIGLETAGIRLPLARVGGGDGVAGAGGFPVMVGTRHEQIRRLRDQGRLAGAPPVAGEGFVQLVDGAFDGRGGMVVGGADGRGLGAALDWLATRAPYLWTYGKGETRLADLDTEVRRFVQAREAPGQVALALAKLDHWAGRLADDAPARVEVEIAAKEMPAGVRAVAEAMLRDHLPESDIQVSTWPTGFGVGDTIFTQDWDLPWEVDEVRRVLDSDVYPGVTAGEPARVQIRVSEPPEVREALADEIRDELARRGVDDPEVAVLNAYKQGYSWLHEVVLPRLRGRDVAGIDITYHTLEESDEVRWQTIAADTRWLQELYPIDAVLARELAIPDSAVTFHPTRAAEPVYTVVVHDAEGREVLRESFDPHYVVRPFFDLFPEYEQVRVTTGWITAASGADTLVDRRVVTDPERFWDRLQTDTYRRITDYVLDTQDGRPSPSNAPYFDEFRVNLRMSEPNHRIGVDEEVISSLEALHEDIYFETLTLFDLIGSRYQTSLPYPGRVLPYIDPTGSGQPPRAHVTFTGKAHGAPEVLMRTWRTDDDPEPLLQRYALDPLPYPAPRTVGVTVAAGDDGLRQLLMRVEARDSVDRTAEFEGRASEGSIDRQFPSVELTRSMLDALGRLHRAGVFRDRLSWDRVGELALDLRVQGDSTFMALATLPRSDAPASTDTPRLLASGWHWDGSRMVQWDAPIPPAESDSVLARLNTFPGVDVYYLTHSFLGQPVFAADFLPADEGRFVSQAKLNALKPTLLLSGRQHANEVSSTSHILRLGELLATDSTYRALLKCVNVVLHPVTNPDGARLAVQMQETNPDFMLHAGYLGALGVDATSGERDDDPMYPESQARRRLRETWLPDVYMNMHGYPSHEWVQYFAGYSAWVRSRRGGQRDWWTPRGWFVPGLSWVDDDENPDYKTAQFAILDSVAASITGDPQVDAMNRRLYARYRKYGAQDRQEFTEYFHDGILVNLRLRGQDGIGTGVYSPRITYFSTTTEAPDETARGDWLKLVASAGLDHASALLRYLAAGDFDVMREAQAFDHAVTRSIFRTKPVLPPGESDAENDEGGGPRP